MSMYRCQVCKQYSRSQWRRVGLGSVCSEKCAATLRSRPRGGQPRHPWGEVSEGVTPSTFVTLASAEDEFATTGEESAISAGTAPATIHMSHDSAELPSATNHQPSGSAEPPSATKVATRSSAAVAATTDGNTSAGSPRHQALPGCVEPDPRRRVEEACAESDPRRLVVQGSAEPHPRRRVVQGSAEPDPRHVPRGDIIARDMRCRFCGTTQDLHVHHIVYRSGGGGDEATNLITLCLRHHALVHSDKRRWQPVLQAYIEIFYRDDRRTFLLALERQLAAG